MPGHPVDNGSAMDDFPAVLRRYPAAVRPSGEIEDLGNAGGLSGSRLWRFPAGPGLLLARAWPVDGPPRPLREAVHDWLRDAGRLGFVPVPIPGLDGRSLYEQGGRLWEVTPWMPGRADPSRPADSARLAAGFAGLAAFHQALAGRRTGGASPGLSTRLREVEAWAGGDFLALERSLGRQPADPLLEPATRWLAAARPAAAGLRDALRAALGMRVDRQPCLRDVRPEHLLFTGDRLTGLVDFGAMGLETVAADLARLLAEWVGDDPARRASALAAYHAVRPLDPAETALIEVFERSGAVLGGGHWLRWRFLEGRAFDDPSAVPLGLDRALARLEGRVPPGVSPTRS